MADGERGQGGAGAPPAADVADAAGGEAPVRDLSFLYAGLGVAAVAFAFMLAIFALTGLPPFGETETPEEVAEQYLDALEEGKVSTAYRLLCERQREQTSLAAFSDNVEALAQQFGKLLEHEILESREQGEAARVVYTIRAEKSPVNRIEAELVKEGGDWRLCAFARQAG